MVLNPKWVVKKPFGGVVTRNMAEKKVTKIVFFTKIKNEAMGVQYLANIK